MTTAPQRPELYAAGRGRMGALIALLLRTLLRDGTLAGVAVPALLAAVAVGVAGTATGSAWLAPFDGGLAALSLAMPLTAGALLAACL